jgi:hypothetical protein
MKRYAIWVKSYKHGKYVMWPDTFPSRESAKKRIKFIQDAGKRGGNVEGWERIFRKPIIRPVKRLRKVV